MKKYKNFCKLDEKGFTLMEMVIAMAIGLFLSTMMYKTVTVNNKAVALQMRKAEIQQNLRASIFVIETEIKRIGFNPMNLQGIHAPGITLADKGRMCFQADLNGNGRSFSAVMAYSGGNITPLTDPEEVITIDLGSGDANVDGVADADGVAKLMRDTVNEAGHFRYLTVANNIEVLDFVYLDKDGERINVVDDEVQYPIPAISLSLIKKIQVTIVARSSTERRDYVNSHNYVNAQGKEILAAKNDGYDRTLLAKTIDCRNLGLL